MQLYMILKPIKIQQKKTVANRETVVRETVVRRGEVLRKDIKQKYFPTDFEMLPKKQQLAINEWCNQIPVVGFNSGKYDLNLIKKYFVTPRGGGG